MAKVNYQFQKAERERLKQAKKDAKRAEREQAAADGVDRPATEPVTTKASTADA